MNKVAMLLGAAALAVAGGAIAQNASPAPMGGMMGKSMTRAEADAHAREMFAKMDVNKDGKLDKADREQARDAKKLDHFKKLDKDGNGSISQSEFMAAGQGHDGPGRGMGDKDGMKGHRMGMGGPGGGMEGPMRGRQGMGGHKGMDGMMGPMMGMADADKDGTITQAEFLAAHAKHFDMIDTNKDGTITPEERRAAMTKMREHMKQMRGSKGAPEASHDHPAGA